MISYDLKTQKLFKYWLITLIFLILSMISVGGLTRLTESGLSITQWELFKGILPPLNQNDWKDYFTLYKEIPQYKLLNYNMTLNEFKIIFYWEYFHRLLGRIIGLFFLIPLVLFSLNKKIQFKNLFSYYVIFFLILFQGYIGWYMVKSGLTNDVTVSHYRLASHLLLAFLIISILFWSLLNVQNNTQKKFISMSKVGLSIKILILLLFVQIILGAFVSGLDAGNIYQTWPYMNLAFFPDDVLINNFNDLLDFNNRSLVQFFHRNLAYLIFVYVIFVGYLIFFNKKTIFKYYVLVFTLVLVQVVMGILTLLTNLNIYLAALHQITSLLLLFSTIHLHYVFID